MTLLFKVFYALVMLACLGLVSMFLLGIYWQVVPYDIEYIYDQHQLPILSPTLKAGDVIRWRAHYAIYIEGIRVEYKYILEPAVGQGACDYKILLEGTSITRKTEQDHISAMVRVPEGFHPCTYHVRIESVFHPNPSQRIISIEAQTQDFTVI